MTRDETILAAMEMMKWGESDWADGEEVQYSPKQGKGSGVWTTTDNPLWNWEHYDYRIKPTAKLRPWTADEVPLGAWIRSKVHSWKCLIIEVDSQGRIGVHGGNIPLDYALQNNEHSTDGGKTWLPCGVMEEAK